jgi:hypothetical protein
MTDLRQTADPEICAQWDWCPYCKNGLDTGLQCDQCLADLMPVQEALRELQRLRSSGGAEVKPLTVQEFVRADDATRERIGEGIARRAFARQSPEPGGQPPKFYRLQDVYDRFHFVDYDARMWELIVVPQPLTKGEQHV